MSEWEEDRNRKFISFGSLADFSYFFPASIDIVEEFLRLQKKSYILMQI